MATALDSVRWIHGAPDCSAITDPLLQVHAFDGDTFVLRQSKCFNFEGNFMYLLFGSERAILFDSGSPPGPVNPGGVLPLRETLEKAMDQWLAKRGIASIDLIVAHTHGHQDHVFWDRQFVGRPRTTIVKPGLASVKQFFGLASWPEGQAILELGSRPLTILPIPGHEVEHIAIYDARTQILLTGDTLYPGLLTVRDWSAYRRSAARLAGFADQHPVSLVLGDHVEMKKAPGELYPIGTTYQPDEHALPLTAEHLREWHQACEAMAAAPHQDVHRDFIIDEPVA